MWCATLVLSTCNANRSAKYFACVTNYYPLGFPTLTRSITHLYYNRVLTTDARDAFARPRPSLPDDIFTWRRREIREILRGDAPSWRHATFLAAPCACLSRRGIGIRRRCRLTIVR